MIRLFLAVVLPIIAVFRVRHLRARDAAHKARVKHVEAEAERVAESERMLFLAVHMPKPRALAYTTRATLVSLTTVFVTVVLVFPTSMVMIGTDETGHLNRKHLADPLPKGRILAVADESGTTRKGPQTEILGPGFHFSLGIADRT